jgi:hypothetical protein
MLYVGVTNERQKQQFQHGSGPLNFGRLALEDVASVVIDDAHVSRDQLRIEELEGGQVKLENRGRSTVFFRDGAKLPPRESRELSLPLHVTVGQTVIEVSSESKDPSLSGDRRTIMVDSFKDVAFVALGDTADDFQFPIATGYRQLNSFTTDAERYKEVLRLAENTLAFLGSVSLAVLDDERRVQMSEALGQPTTSFWQGGISPGHWLQLAIHATRRLRDQSDSQLAEHLGGLELNKENRGVGKLLRSLVQAKNDFKHDRGPSVASEYKVACLLVTGVLSQVLGYLRFLADFRFYLVRDVNPHRRGNMADVVFLRCMGSNPGFLTEQWVYAPSVRKGDLYIELEPERLAPLYPFIHAQACEQCKAREFYFVDRLDAQRNGDSGTRGCVAGLKSFDRGHTAKDADIGFEMQDLFGGGHAESA